MRLICPNCGAQYEVGEDVIPEAGRDVQCSNCAHTWFETPGASEAREAGVDAAPTPSADTPAQAPSEPQEHTDQSSGDTAPQTDDDTLAQPQDATPEGWSDDASSEDTQASAQPSEDTRAEQNIPHATDGKDAAKDTTTTSEASESGTDDSAMSQERSTVTPSVAEILRSEAAREGARRTADADTGIESQPDLGLDRPLDRDEKLAEEARRRMARLRGEAAPAIGATTAVAAGARGEMLPDVEEINSSLRAEDERSGASDPVDPSKTKRRKSGFRRGFMTVLLIALLALLLYILAPRISAMIPALEPALSSYVDMVDRLRLWLDLKLQGLLPGDGAET